MFALSGRKALLGLALGILIVTFSISACSSSSSGPPVGTYATGSPTQWELKVTEELIVFGVSGLLIEEDEYSASNGQITLERVAGPGPGTCAGAATYEWSSEGDSVTFTLVQDSCGERAEHMTLGPWTRQ